MPRRGVRNGVFVLLAFLFMAGLIALVKFRPPARVLPPESAEIQRLRFSKTENAWFVLQEAVDLIPEQPFVDPRTTVDYKFGPVGHFTGICLADDNPEHIAWVRGCEPAITRAQDALGMDQLLLPEDFSNVENIWEPLSKADPFSYLPAAMLAMAALEATNGGKPQIVFGYFRDALRLALMLRNAIQRDFLPGDRSLCRLARLLDAEAQQQALAWLIEFNSAKPPPRRAVEDRLRIAQAWKGGWKEALTPFDPTQIPYLVKGLLKSGPSRRIFAANVDAVIDACCLPEPEFRQWTNQFPEVADAVFWSFPGFHWYGFGRWNDSFQTSLDVMELVLAIELYHHKHGAYPESLDALAPEFLPIVPADVVREGPFFYRRAEVDYWLAQYYGQEVRDPAQLTYSDILISPPGFE